MRIVETVTEYVEPQEPWITPSEVADLCCEEVEVPVCLEKTEAWSGFTPVEMAEKLGITLDDEGRDSAGNYVTFELTRPSSGICGEQITEVVKRQKPCCDGVLSIQWDYENSVELITDNSLGDVYVTGGQGPYNWRVRGNGFAFNSTGTIRDAITTEPFIRIYTKDSCGSATVYVTDNCSSVNEVIRSTEGIWIGGYYYFVDDNVLHNLFGESVHLTDCCLIEEGDSSLQTNLYYGELDAYLWNASTSSFNIHCSEKGWYKQTSWEDVRDPIIAAGAVKGQHPNVYLPNGPINAGDAPQCGGGSWAC